MIDKQDLDNQENIQLPLKTIYTIIVSAAVASIIAGGGVYLWQEKIHDREQEELKSEIQRLKDEEEPQTNEDNDESDQNANDQNTEGIVEFDSCGKKEEYENLGWWKNFKEQIEKIDFFNTSYIQWVVTDGGKEERTHSEFCEDNPNRDICGDRVYRKLSINDFGEGCLSKDNSLFVAVFPGGYLSPGNHVFKYQIPERKLEEAERTNEEKNTSWVDAPKVFLERTGQIILMNGAEGDAGCWSKANYQYNYVDNTIKLTERCTGCYDTEEDCKTY